MVFPIQSESLALNRTHSIQSPSNCPGKACGSFRLRYACDARWRCSFTCLHSWVLATNYATADAYLQIVWAAQCMVAMLSSSSSPINWSVWCHSRVMIWCLMRSSVPSSSMCVTLLSTYSLKFSKLFIPIKRLSLNRTAHQHCHAMWHQLLWWCMWFVQRATLTSIVTWLRISDALWMHYPQTMMRFKRIMSQCWSRIFSLVVQQATKNSGRDRNCTTDLFCDWLLRYQCVCTELC